MRHWTSMIVLQRTPISSRPQITDGGEELEGEQKCVHTDLEPDNASMEIG